jgi:hypothetical protein
MENTIETAIGPVTVREMTLGTVFRLIDALAGADLRALSILDIIVYRRADILSAAAEAIAMPEGKTLEDLPFYDALRVWDLFHAVNVAVFNRMDLVDQFDSALRRVSALAADCGECSDEMDCRDYPA